MHFDEDALTLDADRALNIQRLKSFISEKFLAPLAEPVTFGHGALDFLQEAVLVAGSEAPFAYDNLILFAPVLAQTNVAVQVLLDHVLFNCNVFESRDKLQRLGGLRRRDSLRFLRFRCRSSLRLGRLLVLFIRFGNLRQVVAIANDVWLELVLLLLTLLLLMLLLLL